MRLPLLTKTKARAITRNAPAATVFAVAAWQSYWHIVEVAHRYLPTQQSTAHPEIAYLLPLSIDGMMVIATRYLKHAPTRLARALASLTLAAGVVGTLLANVAAADPTLPSQILSATPAIAMILTGLLLHLGALPGTRRPAQTRRPTPTPTKQPAKQPTKRTTATTTRASRTPQPAIQ